MSPTLRRLALLAILVAAGCSADGGGATADGTAFVRDSKLPSILWIDSTGALAGLIGGTGQGPAEFASVIGMGIRPDTLWLTDTRRRRMVFFSHTGELHGARPWLPWNVQIGIDHFHAVFPRGLMPGGLMVAHIPTRTPPENAPTAPPHGTVGPLTIVDSASTARDTIDWLAQASSLFILDMAASGVLHFPGPNHFMDTPLWRVASDGSVIVVVDREAATSKQASEYRVRVWNGAAELTLERRVQYPPVPVHAGTVDSIIDEYVTDMASYYPTRDAARRTLSRPGKILAATRSLVWVVELDADDVPTLLRYPIVTRPSGDENES